MWSAGSATLLAEIVFYANKPFGQLDQLPYWPKVDFVSVMDTLDMAIIICQRKRFFCTNHICPKASLTFYSIVTPFDAFEISCI